MLRNLVPIMPTQKTLSLFLNLVAFVLVCSVAASDASTDPRVFLVSPRVGSVNGGTRITMYGKDFAETLFTLGNDNIGNVVRLTGLESYDCQIHQDGNTKNKVTCDTSPMPAGVYDIKLTVNGVDVPETSICSNCKFEAKMDNTPTIETVTPPSGTPGEIVALEGNLKTSKYGTNVPDEGLSKILRVYYGSHKCNLQRADDELYGLEYNTATKKGYMKCKPEGTYIGNSHFSYLVSNNYGRSLQNGLTKFPRSNGISMFQSFTEISDLSMNEGSLAGGTEITISGKHFDETVSPVKVDIDGSECVVSQPINDTTIVCKTSAFKNEGKEHFTGGRGFIAYVHSGITDAASINTSSTPFEHLDSSSWTAKEGQGPHTVLMTGYFIPVFAGDYGFCVEAKSNAKVYISSTGHPANKTQVSSGRSTCNSFTFIRLKKYQRCYVEVHYSSSAADSYVKVGAFFKQSKYFETETKWAWHETQKISIAGRTDPEVQYLKVNASGNSTAVTDVQRLTISGDPSSTFAIGLDGIFTTGFSLSALAAADVEAALKKLPSIRGDVSVELESTLDNATLIISSTFNGGFVNDYEGVILSGQEGSVQFNNTKTSNGVGASNYFALSMNGLATSGLQAGASANQLKSELDKVLSVECHPILNGGHLLQYEAPQSLMTNIVSDREPFCGRFSLKNSRYIFYDTDNGIRLSGSRNRFLCFAYTGRGDLRRFHIYFQDIEDGQTSNVYRYLSISNTNKDLTKWNYWCEDIYTFVKANSNGLSQVVKWIKVDKADNQYDLFIDHVAFRPSPPVDVSLFGKISVWRKPQLKPNGFYIKTVTVTKPAANEYEITLKPHDCGHHFPIFDVLNGNINRTNEASIPIEGSYKIKFDGKYTDPIPVTLKAEPDTINSLLTTSNIGYSEVTGKGTCSAFEYTIKMISKTGDQPMMSIEGSKLVGDSVKWSVSLIKNGGLWLKPIMGDLLRTHHNKPQVIVYINNVPTRCANNTDCTFEGLSDATPVVTSISPSSGSHGDTVTVNGNGFDGDNANNKVMFGKTPCLVTASTTSSITCQVSNGPSGSSPVNVNVNGKGYAKANATFTFVLGVSGAYGPVGSIEGGSILTVQGYGFTSEVNVTIGGNPCIVVNATESQIDCIAPRAQTTSTTTAEIRVLQEGSDMAAGNFNYSTINMPVIQSLNVSNPVDGGVAMKIQGDNFGSDEMPVTLDNHPVQVVSYSNSMIIVILPSLPNGDYRLLVNVKGKGYADLRNNSIPDVSYVFIVNAIYPVFGSMYGGTDVTVSGSGLDESNHVLIGKHVCKVTSASSSKLKCRIDHTGDEHQIHANGTHKFYGKGYAWDKDQITILVGDTITWHWETPFYVSDIKYAVRQTVKGIDLEDMPGGFTSGPSSRKGYYSHQFTSPGTYHYWTNYMNSGASIFFRGKVYVEERHSSIEKLTVRRNGFEATYNRSGSISPPQSGCATVTANITGCVDNTTLVESALGIEFKFLKCFSPIVNNISHISGSFDDVISMQGEGFGSQVCENEVMYGNGGCTTIVNSTDSLDFQISPSCKPPVNELHGFQLRVNNLGYAVMALPYSLSRFGLIPIVQSFSPSSGSRVGGTKVTITGAGFTGGSNNIFVQFERLTCPIESVNYTHIICITECVGGCNADSMSFAVYVGSRRANCDQSVCRYNTSDAETPQVTDISPNSTSTASTTFTITGADFSSDLTVTIGKKDCIISGSVNSTEFVCVAGRLPAGTNKVSVLVPNLGYATSSVTVSSQAVASVSSPIESSAHGGANLVIDGNGFVSGATTVEVGGAQCSIVSVTLSQVTCTLPALPVGSKTITLMSNGQAYPSMNLNYSLAATPQVNSISPDNGVYQDTITIVGTSFGSNTPQVMIGNAKCVVTSSSDTRIRCTLGAQNTGRYAVQVLASDRGLSNKNHMFTYQLSTFSISPNRGSTNGGQYITLTGSGFLENSTTVEICGKVCSQVSVNSSSYVCITSSNSAATCDVVAEVQNIVQTLSAGYNYDSSLDTTITDVSPSRGGTGGGLTITITGTNFGTSAGDVEVIIAGTNCVVSTCADTQIECVTGASTHNPRSVAAQVEVYRNGWGLAKQINASFEYIDVWSSRFTWGGNDLPTEGEFIIIQKGQKILLDTDTPVLSMLLIQGGHLIFDKKDIELQSQYILITDGGTLEVGTEQEPFEHKAIITMHGHVRSKELPVYGAKGIGVREGMLELHGRHIPYPWTYLDATATEGSTTISLVNSVNWLPGDEIVIATTGDRRSQKESEVRKISSVSADGKQLTLDEPLKYEHISFNETFGTRTVQFRAEVGLLTRNVVVRGHRNVQFDYKIEACSAGFNPGQFATQTCFQGRFGEEVGSDQYGAHILIHQPNKNTQVAQAHIENVEITHAGQAFRLGRYPVHFHLNGNMSESYVRRCAIHNTFNRAVNIHGSHNTMVEHNVVYNVMGGALFLEDGIETGNTFQYNLEILIKSSTSLLNDDITPAAIWVTNPYNIVRHNTAAGGTHFGVWYRMHKHPDGPSYTNNICPQNMPFGEYRNNTAHSLGWFGIWIFETYIPKDSMVCSSSAPHKVAKLYSLTAWNNNEGAETVNTGSVQFHDFVIVSNHKSSIHFSIIANNPPKFDAANGPGLFNSIIVAYHPGLRGARSSTGVVLPWQNGMLVKDVEFYNFDKPGSACFKWVTAAGICTVNCGGFMSATTNLTFENSPNKVRFAWENEGVIKDLDGSLTGIVGGSSVACSGSFDPSKCTPNASMSVGVSGCVCDASVKLVRFSFNEISPKSLQYKNAMFTSKFGTTQSPWEAKRVTHPSGWQVVLSANMAYDFTFENAAQVVNISYSGRFYELTGDDFVIFTQNAYQMPDRFYVDGVTNHKPSFVSPIDKSVINHGDWYYNQTASEITYALKNSHGDQLAVALRVVRCFFRGCKPPPSALSVLVQPENAEYTSLSATWAGLTPHGNPPQPNDDLYIPFDRWIIVNTVLPPLGKVVIDGGLQFAENFTQPNQLEADYIYIRGRLIAGWSDQNPFLGKLSIRLRGNHNTPNYDVTDGPNLGSKFIAVFGGLQLHGQNPGVMKTYLALEAATGDVSITVKDDIKWKVGNEIVISTTDYNAWHTETFRITAVSGRTLSLNGTIKYRHIAHTENAGGKTVEMRASVALLSRNIVVESASYIEKESFGARVVVAQTAHDGKFYTGFAQISNVEFVHCGQEGFTSSYDPRFCLSYMSVSSDKSKIRYSYVRYNAFHNGLSTAVGVFSTDGLEIEDNVIHHTVGPGIVIEAAGAIVKRNLVMLSVWIGAYLDREESGNYDFPGGIDARKGVNLVLVNNTIAGSERAGYTLPAQACNTPSNDLWYGNTAHGCQGGILLFGGDPKADPNCVTFSGYTLWKNFDYGIYYFGGQNLVVEDNIFIENSIGIMPFIMGPASLGHSFANKYCTIKDNVFIGKTSTFSESLDTMPRDDNVAFSSQARGVASGKTCGQIGLMFATFTSGSNLTPRKPWVNIMSYQAIKGITKVEGNLFKNFGSCTGGRDHVIAPNKNNDDTIHPLVISGSTHENVEQNSLVLFFKPNLGKVNPSDCVDMDCDGHKKCILTDFDGTFLGYKGSVLPEAAFEWDGDRRRGLGNYRIPTAMLTTNDGNRLDPDVLAPHKGIYGIDKCTWKAQWNAYECNNNMTYRMMVAESMDSDTETRRISPVAVWQPEGYIDLVNGPQDHGWCFGYTCQKRLSTFPIVVALGKPYHLYLTSTNPKVMRYMILNSKSDDCVLLSMWYNTINRLEVEVDGRVKLPNNGFYDANNRYRVKFNSYPGEFMPKLGNATNGENYVDQVSQTIYWVQCGNSAIKVRRTKALIVSFTLPEMTVDQFFGEQLIENLAAFLNIDPSKVRVVNVVSANTNQSRKKRNTRTTTVFVEISDAPGETPSTDLSQIEDIIINMVQLGNPSEVLNVSVLYTAIIPPDGDSESPVVLQKPGALVLDTVPVANVSELNHFSVQPKLKIVDSSGDVVSHLGSDTLRWEVKVMIKSGGTSRASLVGTTQLNFTAGWANFTDLAIDDLGTDYILEFRIVFPENASHYNITTTQPLHIYGKDFRPKALLLTNRILTNNTFQLQASLVDRDTNQDWTNIGWDNHTWQATASIYDSTVYDGSITGDTTVDFNTSTGVAVFSSQLNRPGKCQLLVVIRSNPSGYLLKMVVKLDVLTPSQSSMIVEENHVMEFSFPITYNPARADSWALQVMNTYSDMPEFKVTGYSHRSGSTYIALSIEASKSGYNQTLHAICGDIEDGRNFTFDGTTVRMSTVFKIDGKQHYGVFCGPIPKKKYDDGYGFDTKYIIIIAVLAFVIIVKFGLLIFKCNSKNTKHTDVVTPSGTPVPGNYYKDNDLLRDVLLREETSSSMKSIINNRPPTGTYLNDPFELKVDSRRSTPTQVW